MNLFFFLNWALLLVFADWVRRDFINQCGGIYSQELVFHGALAMSPRKGTLAPEPDGLG